MIQGSLFDVAPKTRIEQAAAVLTCSFGELWTGPHPLCEAHAKEMSVAFDRDVAAGIYDAQGYTPNERKAQQRKR